MDKKEAISVVAQVCSVYKGTAQEHQVIAQAIQYLNSLEDKKTEVPEARKKLPIA